MITGTARRVYNNKQTVNKMSFKNTRNKLETIHNQYHQRYIYTRGIVFTTFAKMAITSSAICNSDYFAVSKFTDSAELCSRAYREQDCDYFIERLSGRHVGSPDDLNEDRDDTESASVTSGVFGGVISMYSGEKTLL